VRHGVQGRYEQRRERGYAFEYERESLDAIGAEIVVVPVESEAQFAAAVADAMR